MFTRKSLVSLVKHFKIIYELLWTLFWSNALLYTICFDFEQPRCLIFNSGEEKWISSKEKQFELQCCYFNYNDKSFSKVTTFLYILRFYNIKKIASLDVFSLQYHKLKTEITQNLVEQGQKFTTLMKTHHCNYKSLTYIQQTADSF